MPAMSPTPQTPPPSHEEHDEHDELRVTWMPAFPAAAVTLILCAILPPIGALLAVAGLVTVVLRLVQRRWDVWAWAGVGAIIGGAVFGLLLLLHALF
jgi:hypothetical protein